MWLVPLLLVLVAQLGAPPHVRIVRDSPVSTVTNLAAFSRGGRVFITATKGGTAPYTLYRSASQITDLTGLTPYPTVDDDSYRYLWDDSATVENLHSGLLIPGSAGEAITTTASRRLLSTEILFVLTTPSGADGSWYYAVKNAADATITVGVNSLSSPVAESYQAIPSFTFVNAWTGGSGSNRYRTLFDWEDTSTWWHGNWGYYGNKAVITQSATADPLVGGTLYPATLFLHGAGSAGYFDPTGVGDNVDTRGFYVSPLDLNLAGIMDASSYHAQRNHSFWSGYPTEANPTTIQRNVTAARIVRYIQALAALSGNPYQIDPTRLYIRGASMGGMSVHHVYDAVNAGIFAAADVISGIPTFRRWTGCGGTLAPNGTVGLWGEHADFRLATDNQLVWAEWANVLNTVLQARTLPPVFYGWGTDDSHPPCIFQQATDAAEAVYQGVFSKWVLNGGHGNIEVKAPGETTGMYLRIKTNEAFPAFSSLSNNDDDTNMTASGQHNLNVDWHCSLHSLVGGSAIVDTATAFGMSFKSLSGTPTGRVTIRNQQAFIVPVGRTAVFSTDNGQTGNMTRNTDGSLTTPVISFPTTVMRLLLTIQPIISGNARVIIQHE